LPPFGKPGQRIDVNVSSIGNAESLHGGSLLMTPLLGADGQLYAMAQGNLIVGGFSASGGDGSKLTVNIPSAGRIPNGATIERIAPGGLDKQRFITINLKNPDFTTATNLMDAVNEIFGNGSAKALDSTSVVVRAPASIEKKIAFLSVLENIRIEPGEAAAKIIVNSRTGTVVIGSNVKVLPAAVTHGSLVVTIKENVSVSQPGAFARRGDTAVTTDSSVSATQEKSKMFLIKGFVTLDEIVRAINDVGAAPSDLVAVLEALDKLGALKAELIVI
ncbi:MAG: flagellar basal body P-ring protein FlgI, partial [Sinobacterium sp.]|nr:flagellar basal body P-ring protein FlgI [Sinobacterium sp.]